MTTRTPAASLLLVAALAGCPTLEEVPPPESTPLPDAPGLIVVSGAPDGRVDFETVIWDQPELRSIVLRALGTGSIGFELVVTGEGFELEGEAAHTLAAGDEVEVAIRFAPPWDGTATGRLDVVPDSFGVSIGLVGMGLAPTLLVEETVDLALTAPGCERAQDVWLRNAGRRPLTLDAAELVVTDGGLLELSRAQAPTLQPGEEHRMEVRFAPEAEGETTGEIILDGGFPSPDAIRVPVLAPAERERPLVDLFLQAPSAAVDLLLVVDDSGSANDSLLQFTAFLDGLIPLLDAAGADYRIAVVSTSFNDGGAFQGPGPDLVVTPDLFDPVGRLQINADLGGNGSGTERAFDSAYLALQPAMLASGGPNEGFLRDEAMLHVITWMDEGEQSRLLADGDPAAYVAFFESLKQAPFAAVMSDISGGLTGCDDVGAAAPGVDLVTASQLTGGVSTLICDSEYLPAFAGHAWRTEGLDGVFPLSDEPLPGTLVVTVDGMEVPTWTYEAGEVVFDVATVPAEGSVVEITYAGLPTCE